jgi:hypothetical protein
VHDEPVVGRIVDDVFEGGDVLILRLDHLGPEAAAEDVVAAAVAVVEGARVGAVEVAHAVGEVGPGRLEEEVVVVPQQAAGVDSPAVAALYPPQDVEKDGPVSVVRDDLGAVVPGRGNVVVGPGGEVTAWASHPPTVTATVTPIRTARSFVPGLTRPRHVPGRRRVSSGRLLRGGGLRGRAADYAATLERSRC